MYKSGTLGAPPTCILFYGYLSSTDRRKFLLREAVTRTWVPRFLRKSIIREPQQVIRGDAEKHSEPKDCLGSGALFARLPIADGSVAELQLLRKLILSDSCVFAKLFQAFPEDAAVKFLHKNNLTKISVKRLTSNYY